VAVFLVGLVIRKTPPAAAKGAMLIGLPLYGFCRFARFIWNIPGAGEIAPGLRHAIVAFNSWAFLHHMGLVFLVLVAYMLIITAIKPLKEPVSMPTKSSLDTTVYPQIYVLGCIIIVLTIALYIIFW